MIFKILNHQAGFDLYKLTNHHKALLRASLLSGEDALVAWKQWKSSIDIDHLDSASYPLLCLLYQNLLRHNVDDAYMPRLKGIYRRTWYANQLVLKQLETLVKALKAAEVEHIILGDAALMAHSGQENGYRPINGLNLLVRSVNPEPLLSILAPLGWHQSTTQKKGSRFSLSLCDFQNRSLLLQQHIFWAKPQEFTVQQLWGYAIHCPPIGDTSRLVLSPTDQLLHICLIAFYRSQTPQIHWLADAAIFIQNRENEIDWFRLVSQAQRYELIIPVSNMLSFMNEYLKVEVPDWVEPTLAKMPIARQERWKYPVSLVNKKLTI